MQHLLKPLIVSWGYESETPSTSSFVDLNEWIGTRDISAFLTVPAAIEFQAKHKWDRVRAACHELAGDAQSRICDLNGLAALHPQSDNWFVQLVAVPLPADVDVVSFKSRLYEEYRIEVPVLTWKDKKLIRVSIQGYNSKRDVDHLLTALTKLLN